MGITCCNFRQGIWQEQTVSWPRAMSLPEPNWEAKEWYIALSRTVVAFSNSFRDRKYSLTGSLVNANTQNRQWWHKNSFISSVITRLYFVHDLENLSFFLSVGNFKTYCVSTFVKAGDSQEAVLTWRLMDLALQSANSWETCISR